MFTTAALISRSEAKRIAFFSVVIILVLLIFDGILFQSYHVKTATHYTMSWMYNHDALVLGLHILLVILATWFFLPPAPLVLASGFVFQNIYNEGWGYLLGWLASLLGAVIGGTLAYSRAQYLSGYLFEVLCDRYPILNVVEKALDKSPLRVMMLLRLNPLLPFGMLNYVFAMKGVDIGLFVAAMAAVMQWYLFLTCVGAALSNMYNGYSFTGYAIGAACGAIVMMVVWYLAKNELLAEVRVARSAEDASDRKKRGLAAKLKLITGGSSRRGRSRSRGRNRNRSRSRSRSRSTNRTRHGTSSRSKQSEVPNNIVEKSDLSGTDYVCMQVLGEDTDYVGRNIYRDYLDVTEIILDNFS